MAKLHVRGEKSEIIATNTVAYGCLGVFFLRPKTQRISKSSMQTDLLTLATHYLLLFVPIFNIESETFLHLIVK